MIAHHASGGCNLRSGDLIGTGTISGLENTQRGSLLELTAGGKRAIELPNGEIRHFLEDGDEILFRATCHRDGFRLDRFRRLRWTNSSSRGACFGGVVFGSTDCFYNASGSSMRLLNNRYSGNVYRRGSYYAPKVR